MLRIASAAAALCLVSGLAMAEPVRLDTAQLQSTAAGQLTFNWGSHNNSANVFAVNYNTTNQTAVGIGLGGAGVAANGNLTQQQNNVQIRQR